MTTDVHVTESSEPDASSPGRRSYAEPLQPPAARAAALIPRGPPLGQWVFKLVTSELRGHNVPAAEAVKEGIAGGRGTDPDFEPRYDPQLLEQWEEQR
jgi:hypothetical protein